MTDDAHRPLTEEEIAEKRAAHHPDGAGVCMCGQLWPCEWSRLLATLDALRAALEMTVEALYGRESVSDSIDAARDALTPRDTPEEPPDEGSAAR